jgi:ribose-phosphate pyrophosphokinase
LSEAFIAGNFTLRILLSDGQNVFWVHSMMLISGPGSEQVGEEIAGILGVEAAVVEHRVFPDGENYIRLTAEVGGRDVVLVQSTAPPQDRRLVQLLLTLDAIREGEPKSVAVVSPYMAYAR